MLHDRTEDSVIVKLAGLDGSRDPYQLLIDDPAGTDVQVANFGIPHLPRRKSNFLTRAVQQAPGVFRCKPIVNGCATECNGTTLLLNDLRRIWVVSPSIANY
jgi:hypothetical protein